MTDAPLGPRRAPRRDDRAPGHDVGAPSAARLALVAQRFRVLGEPARLQLLEALRHGGACVSDLVARTAMSQANASRHLQLLHAAGFVVRARRGLHVEYAIASPDVFTLCDAVCGQIDDDMARRRAALGAE
jgi:ArsR family transcriptional regulator